MLRFSGSSQNPGSSVLDELQLSNGLLWKAGEETITIIHPAGDKAMNKFLQVMTGNKTSNSCNCGGTRVRGSEIFGMDYANYDSLYSKRLKLLIT